jgi:hypothetical protein
MLVGYVTWHARSSLPFADDFFDDRVQYKFIEEWLDVGLLIR